MGPRLRGDDEGEQADDSLGKGRSCRAPPCGGTEEGEVGAPPDSAFRIVERFDVAVRSAGRRFHPALAVNYWTRPPAQLSKSLIKWELPASSRRKRMAD